MHFPSLIAAKEVLDNHRGDLRLLLQQAIRNASLPQYLTRGIIHHLGLDTQTTSLAHSKRLRGVLTMIVSKSLGLPQQQTDPLAVCVELYHSASLIIDDIQDASESRCDRPALWKLLGIPHAITCAFTLKSLAESAIASAHSYSPLTKVRLIRTLQKCTLTMASGQTEDIVFAGKHGWTGTQFSRVAIRKTGSLLGTAMLLPAIASRTFNFSDARALYRIGLRFGILHQLNDDLDDSHPLINARLAVKNIPFGASCYDIPANGNYADSADIKRDATRLVLPLWVERLKTALLSLPLPPSTHRSDIAVLLLGLATRHSHRPSPTDTSPLISDSRRVIR